MSNPIVITVKRYTGRDTRKQAKWQQERSIATKIESYLNTALSSLPKDATHQFDYCDIAYDTGIAKEAIKRILFANGGGSNGITLKK